jgi:hypothetical protein
MPSTSCVNFLKSWRTPNNPVRILLSVYMDLEFRIAPLRDVGLASRIPSLLSIHHLQK